MHCTRCISSIDLHIHNIMEYMGSSYCYILLRIGRSTKHLLAMQDVPCLQHVQTVYTLPILRYVSMYMLVLGLAVQKQIATHALFKRAIIIMHSHPINVAMYAFVGFVACRSCTVDGQLTVNSKWMHQQTLVQAYIGKCINILMCKCTHSTWTTTTTLAVLAYVLYVCTQGQKQHTYAKYLQMQRWHVHYCMTMYEGLVSFYIIGE